ncbi:Zinc finger protein 425 [Sciurus carolinensis]|uniref:Zinc finger protein 425 n=1 Tax=Sciurus carolinensis TaxID=30640 RepID=A0AA41N4Q7_SCICA|nr:Zinc finger protein 425 [Sciurus carolinensis]
MFGCKKRFQCSECEKSFHPRCSLITHQVVHTGQRPFACPECGKTFGYKANLKKHLCLHKVLPAWASACGEACRRTFAGTAARSPWAARVRQGLFPEGRPADPPEDARRGGKKLFSCEACGRKLVHKTKFTDYVRVHTGEKPFSCPECKNSFRLKRSLKAHGVQHRGQKPFQCPKCARSFFWRNAMRVHQRLHSEEKPFSCAECGKRLTQHLKSHSAKKPFSCADCGRGFRRCSHLSEHASIHGGEEPSQCTTECDKRFFCKASVRFHQRIHRDERPYASVAKPTLSSPRSPNTCASTTGRRPTSVPKSEFPSERKFEEPPSPAQ